MDRPSDLNSRALEAVLWRHVTVVDVPGVVSDEPRSHVGDGRVVHLSGMSRSDRVAVDAESVATPIPPRLRHGADIDDPGVFWPRWTGWEVVAKLTDQPMLNLITAGALRNRPWHPAVTIAVRALDDLVVAVGWHHRSPLLSNRQLQEHIHDSFPPAPIDRAPPAL